MTSRRVYLAVGLSEVTGLAAGARLDPSGFGAYAVTDAARAAFPTEDEEDLEYDAFVLASRHPRRECRGVVLSVDVPASDVRELSEPVVAQDGASPDDAETAGYAVCLAAAVTADCVVAFHVQDPGAGPDEEFLWYDASELSGFAEP